MEKWPLPEGWEWKRIGEVVLETGRTNPRQNLDQAFTYIEISSIDSLTGKIVEPRVVVGRDAPSRARKVVTTNDVIFATTRPYLRNIALVPQEYDGQVCSTGFCVLRANPRTMIPQWLYHLCRSHIVLKKIEPLMHGATYPAITDSELLSVEIPIPPLDVQRRIVARVEALFAELAAARHTHAAFVHDAERLMESTTREVLSDLELASFELLVESYKNGIYKKKEFYGRGHPSVRMYNIVGGRVNINDAPLLDVTPEELVKYGLLPGDVLVNRVNSRELVGKSGLVGDDLGPCTFESKNIRVRVRLDFADPAYVAVVLNSLQVKQQIQTLLKPAIGQATVNQSDLNSLLIPFTGLSNQRRIVAYLDAVQAHTAELQRTAAALAADLDRTEQAILAQAFRGSL